MVLYIDITKGYLCYPVNFSGGSEYLVFLSQKYTRILKMHQLYSMFIIHVFTKTIRFYNCNLRLVV